MSLGYIIKRNIKMFFKDKGLVLTSLITPMILILLYVTFLKNVYVDSFHSATVTIGIEIEERYINGFVYGWLFSSLLAVSCVTVSFCSNMLMVQDKVTGAAFDLQIAPIKNTKLAFGYYVATVLETYSIILLEALVGFVILAFEGWFLSPLDVCGILFSSFLLVNFGTALSSIIGYFLTTQGQISAVGTIVSSVYGFICGAYMPISQFGDVLQKVLGFLPGTYATSVIRYHYENSVLDKLQSECNFPLEVVNGISKSFDVTMQFMSHGVTTWVSYLVFGLSTLLCVAIYVMMNIKKNAKKSR
jgi:ABC-2 type transporter.